MHTALLKGSNVGSNAVLTAVDCTARLLGGGGGGARRSICNSLLLCGSVGAC